LQVEEQHKLLEQIKEMVLRERNGDLSESDLVFPQPEVILGEGAQGVVKLALLKFTDRVLHVALKSVDLDKDPRNAANLRKEVIPFLP